MLEPLIVLHPEDDDLEIFTEVISVWLTHGFPNDPSLAIFIEILYILIASGQGKLPFRHWLLLYQVQE